MAAVATAGAAPSASSAAVAVRVGGLGAAVAGARRAAGVGTAEGGEAATEPAEDEAPSTASSPASEEEAAGDAATTPPTGAASSFPWGVAPGVAAAGRGRSASRCSSPLRSGREIGMRVVPAARARSARVLTAARLAAGARRGAAGCRFWLGGGGWRAWRDDWRSGRWLSSSLSSRRRLTASRTGRAPYAAPQMGAPPWP